MYKNTANGLIRTPQKETSIVSTPVPNEGSFKGLRRLSSSVLGATVLLGEASRASAALVVSPPRVNDADTWRMYRRSLRVKEGLPHGTPPEGFAMPNQIIQSYIFEELIRSAKSRVLSEKL